jgi:hypothetical protein
MKGNEALKRELLDWDSVADLSGMKNAASKNLPPSVKSANSLS